MTWLERHPREAAHAGPIFIQAPQGAPSEPGERVGVWVEGPGFWVTGLGFHECESLRSSLSAIVLFQG